MERAIRRYWPVFVLPTLLACFIGAFFVMPTDSGRIMMGALAVITLYSVFRKIQQLWKDR